VNLLRAAEFKVGILVLAVAALIAYMSLQVSDDPSMLGRSNEAWFLLNDAGGLVKNSAVRTAGIAVGMIKDIKLQDGQARVELTLRPDIKMKVTASVMIKSQGILGDKHVELTPGGAEDPPLPPKGQIVNVNDKGSLDNVINQVGDIAANLKEVSLVLKESLIKDGTRDHVLGRIVLNIEKLTKDLAEVTGDNKAKIGQIVDQINGITASLDEALSDESEDGFKVVWKRSMARIDSTLKNLDEITGKINRGEGTIGKLVSDEETSEKVTTAVDGISNLIEAGQKISTGIDINTAYLSGIGETTSFNLKIQPGLDRYYLLGFTSSPFGQVTTTKTALSGSQTGTYTSQTTFQNTMVLSAQFAKVFYDFTIRGGLIENYGGLGLDYSFLKGKATASLEFFNFGTMNVRPSVRYSIWKGLYVQGGIYDLLNSSNQNSTYLGAGLFLNNDDLKLLLARSPL